MHRIKKLFASLAVALLLGVALPATTTGCVDALVGPDTTVGPTSNEGTGGGSDPAPDPPPGG